MEKYDISDSFRRRLHTIRITFQYQEYKGHIAYTVGGNCKGLNVMHVDFDCMSVDDIIMLKENDCNFNWDNEYEVYGLVLTDEKGNTCKINDLSENEINDYVVAVEIVECKLEKEC